MFSTLFTVALFIAPAIQGVFADFAVNSPELTQCKDTKITWEKTGAPYNLIVVKASDPCGDALVDLGDVNQTFFNWNKVNIKAGTQVQISLVDANDEEAWSQVLTVKDSGDSSCFDGSSSLVGSSSASGAPSSTANAVYNTVLPSTTPSSTSQTGSDGSDTSNINPVGAANAGTQPFGNSGITARQASTPLLALAGLVAVVTLL